MCDKLDAEIRLLLTYRVYIVHRTIYCCDAMHHILLRRNSVRYEDAQEFT